MDIVTLPVSQVVLPKEDRKKPMVGCDSYQALKDSLKRQGMLTPVFLDSKRVLISGYYRFRAWTELGNKQVPCAFAENFKDVIKLTVGEDWYDRVNEPKEVLFKEPKEQP